MQKRLINILALSFVALLLVINPVSAQGDGGEVVILSIDGPILSPILAEYISNGLETAAARDAELVILELNTPGGSVDLTFKIVEAMRGSPVPVVVYVTPRGAIAGSAGTIITLAGHVAAMAPETAIGAASPIDSSGEDIQKTLEAKIKQALKAQVRALAVNRSPEAIALAEDTIENATAVSVGEAFEVGLIDIVASDNSDLLKQLHGRQVETAAGKITLNTQFLPLHVIEYSFIEELLIILTNANIVFLLLTIGVQAVLIELGQPGGWVAGFVGVVCLSLAGYGLGVLPVNYFGLIFLVTAFVLFFMELKAPVHGALAAAGLASFIVGALVLFNSRGTPEFFQVSIPLVVVTGLGSAATFIAILTFVLRAQKAPIQMGQSSLVGKTGIARQEIPLGGSGKVHLGGEMWSAELAEG
ncbi:MAG: ATP-dependent Clp protease proteolytic subunit, partial [Anaerolineae bacterium]|nr:ATP-dependent Clp protease proteolytic subunit [Anaerolineae bacterium]